MRCALCTRCQLVAGRCVLGGPFTGYVHADPDDPAPQPLYGPLVTPPRIPFPLISDEAS